MAAGAGGLSPARQPPCPFHLGAAPRRTERASAPLAAAWDCTLVRRRRPLAHQRAPPAHAGAVRRRRGPNTSGRPASPTVFTHADSLAEGKPVVLVEGEIDALTVQQTAGDLVKLAVAAGSTAGSRRTVWVAKLALAPQVLVAFDADANGAGDLAAAGRAGTCCPTPDAGVRSAARMSTPCTAPGWMWPVGAAAGLGR